MATNYDMEAIHEAYPYPAVCRIECGGPDEGIWDADGNAVTVDQSKVDAARVELDKLKYKEDRRFEYPEITDQLDMIYHDQVNGTTTFKDSIKVVKDKYPKPS
tara:strand:+ start:672 stop:980 length:309 start_codon:yes stop_codon:yes gene_type:complete